MPTVWNVDWLVQNSQRRYPLASRASAKDVTGSFTLPDDFLIGLSLPVHYAQDVLPSRFLLWRVSVYSSGYGIVIGYDTGTDIVPVASALIPKTTHTFGNSYVLGGVDDFFDSRGFLAVGNTESIDQQPAGTFEFDLDGGQLELDTLRPFLRTLQSLYVRNGDELSQPLVGDIELVADRNMTITPVVVSGQRPQLLFSAIEGEGLNDECFCEGDADVGPIRRLNEVAPNSEGDFTILGDDGIEVEPIANGIRLRNRYTPCCGCRELETVTSDLRQLLTKTALVESVATRLDSSVQQLTLTVLGARLNDQGCSTCS